MKYVAYHRTSTKEQKLDRGVHELKTYAEEHKIRLYKDKVYYDQQTGKDFNRPAYTIVKEEVLEPGDTLIITEIDRLGRSKINTLKELEWFKSKNIRVMILEIPTTLMEFSNIDNNLEKMMLEMMCNMMIELYATLAEAELEKKNKRQREGMERMKANGEWDRYGRPLKMNQKEFNKIYEESRRKGMPQTKIAKSINFSSATYYRYRSNYLDSQVSMIVKSLNKRGYTLNQYDEEHIKMILLKSDMMNHEEIEKIIIESKTIKS